MSIGLFVAGLRFTIHSVLYVLKIMWKLVLANVGLVIACAAMGTLLVRIAHLDPITAYLATSPGGMDTITIIAVGSGVDVGTIVVLQLARSFIVNATGPMIARLTSQVAANYSAAASSS